MAVEKEERVGEMNEIIVQYMQHLGVSDAAKTEFSAKANAIKAMAGYESVWFQRMTTKLHNTLSQITTQSKPLQIDLNLPVVVSNPNEASDGAIVDDQPLNVGESVLMIRVLNSLSP